MRSPDLLDTDRGTTAKPPSHRRSTPIAAAAVIVIVLAGCSTSTDPSPTDSGTAVPTGISPTAGAADTSAAVHVAITLTSADGADACALDQSAVPAGPITFTVANADAPAISEVELLSDNRILGEKENLAPGLDPVTFTTTLGGGTYQVYCPGATPETVDLTVTGAPAPTPTGGVQAVLAQGTTGYADYVNGVITNMVTAVTNLQHAIDDGDLATAQKLYASARPFYERVEPDVSGFVLDGFDATDNHGNLDYLIDMRASNLDPAVGWHGFHTLERDLFQNQKITPTTRQAAAELTANVQYLDTVTANLAYKPEDLANGAAGLLEEVQANKITGEEDLYSHLDLVDFAANIEGAQQAFAFLQPGLTQIDPALTTQVQTQFDNIKSTLDAFKDPNALGGYVTYTAAVRQQHAPTLSKAIQALQEPLARIAEKVATAQ